MTDHDGFDKISFELGRNAEGLQSLNKLFHQHCEDDDRRHEENVKLLRESNNAQKANTDAIQNLALTLAPVAANYRLTKRRLALAASLGLSVLVIISWALDAGVKWVVGWILKMKFGG